MIGFGKNKDKEAGGEPPAEDALETEEAPAPAETEKPEKVKKAGKKVKEPPVIPPAARKTAVQPKKKRFSIKKLLIALVVIAILGGGGFAGYTFFFKAKGASKRSFQQVSMPHLTLPREMLRFSFDHFPGLYDAFLLYEKEVVLFEEEIARIEAIAAKYPDQEKIANRQKKIWEKGKNTLLKEFAKLEKPVKETFVLYQVNPSRGKEQIEASAQDLTSRAKAALEAAQQLTAQIKAMSPKPPEGLLRGTLYKLKKKFL